MLTKTTETGIQALVYLARQVAGAPVSPRSVAKALGISPTYLAKIMAQLVRADILQAHRGAKGGVTFAREPKAVTLLDVVQVLQGIVHGRYCHETSDRVPVCAFHEAMQQLHEATVTILGRWRLNDLVLRPFGEHSKNPRFACLMGALRTARPLSTQSVLSRTSTPLGPARGRSLRAGRRGGAS